MEEKGLIEVIKDKEDMYENSNIEMNNMVVKANVEKLEEELKQIKEILRKCKDKRLTKVVENKDVR